MLNSVVYHSLPNTDLYLSNIHPLPSGKFLVSGRENDINFAELKLARLNADGSLDVSFGVNGYATHDYFGNFDIASRSVVLSGGDIICAGWGYNPQLNVNQPTLSKFDANGQLDMSFGNNGSVAAPFTSGTENIYRRVAIYNSTHVIAAGATTPSSDQDVLVSKYDLNGQPDQTFANNGHLVFDLNGNKDRVNGLEIQTDGKILVGFTGEDPGGSEDFAVMRLNANGIYRFNIWHEWRIYTKLQQ